MKKYNLRVIYGAGTYLTTVEADHIHESNYGYYTFYLGGTMLCRYPIIHTIIESIEPIKAEKNNEPIDLPK